MKFLRKLPIPKEIKSQYPLPEKVASEKAARDAEIKRIFTGESNKFILVIGPCSADREDAVLEYIGRLSELQQEVKDKIMMIPRIYTGKPRTTGDGYKGMLHQPDPSEKPDMLRGIIAIRQLHLKALEQYKMGCADEMLYPENARYLNDLLSYVAIGARSVENQQHRLTASGMDIPVGMKNPTSGDISVMMNAITAAQHPHTFLYRGWEVESDGNPYAHAILRGYVNKHGQTMPNYHFEDLQHLCQTYAEASVATVNGNGLKNPALIVDTNHANSGKRYDEQPRIAGEVLHSMRHDPDVRKLVRGLMIESYLLDGAQKIGENIYGCSITDPCLGWEKTKRLVLEIADTL